MSKKHPVTLDDLPKLDWSSTIREAMHADAALRIAADDNEDELVRANAEREALAYYYVAWIIEGEWSDGRGTEPLAVSGDVFLAEIWRQHNLQELDRPSLS